MCLSLDGSDSIIDTVTDDSCFYVKDIAKYIVDKFGSLGSVELQTIYDDLDRHPIFPSDGFKNEIKEELKLSYGVKFPRGKGIAEFGHGD